MSETTGQHPIEHRPEADFAAYRSALRTWAGGIIATGLVTLGGVAITFYVNTTADRARDEQIHQRLERDLIQLEHDQRAASDATDDLSADLRALKALVESGQADQRARLERIERALDDRRNR